MKRIFALMLAVCLLLCACGGEKPVDTSGGTTVPETTAKPTETTTEATEATVETTAETTEPPVLYRNPLSGEPMDEPYTGRVFTAVCNNIVYAMPQCGISQAEVIYEILAEGGITRCLAVFSDISRVPKIGPIRSARTYLVSLARSYGAVLVHCGGSTYADSLMADIGMEHMDGMYLSVFYRDQNRLNAGYALEHTLFINGPDVTPTAQNKGYATEVPEGVDFGYTFADDATPEGEKAGKVVVNFRNGGKTTTMTYNQKTGLYEAAQYGEPKTDGNTGSVVSYKNVMVLFADTRYADDGYHLMATLTGSGTGYFACGGRIVPIRWSRSGETEPFVYTLEDGTPLTLGVGHTYIGIVPTGSPVDYE